MKTQLSIIICWVFLLVNTNLMANRANTLQIKGVVTASDDGSALPGVNVVEKGTTNGVITDMNGEYTIAVQGESSAITFSYIGYMTEEVKVGSRRVINVQLIPDISSLEEVVVVGYGVQKRQSVTGSVATVSSARREKRKSMPASAPVMMQAYDMAAEQEWNTEGYSPISENGFKSPLDHPLSTFSIDVDAASYANVRRYLTNGSKPPVDAVRIEEMINYFDYDYKQPTNEHPFSVTTEVGICPWNEDNLLMHIGLQGKKISMDNLPPSNIVFLIDVSGSMSDANKLPLLKSAFKMLVKELRPQDKVAMVVYAGAAGEVLSSTPGNQKDKIIDALDQLNAGGSTAGGAGIQLAYKIAEENFVKGGNNRIILATDGDFNIGASSNGEMQRLIEEKRDKGVFITVLGFGMGNYKDDKMEIIADKGNGNYAYIDNLMEAKKVLVNEFGGTLFTIAKDVKLQLEFNPQHVKSYRLIGYENRLLNDEDFNDDKKDAGEMGAGHTVTALYEIAPQKGNKISHDSKVDPLKYQEKNINESKDISGELLTVKLRYKDPDGDKSKLLSQVVDASISEVGQNFYFSASVAAFGMILRNSEHKGKADINMVTDLANKGKGKDVEGYRAEFIRLVKLSEVL